MASANPIEVYKLTPPAKKIKGESIGYTGIIKVRRLSNDQVDIKFDINKGYPSYNSGSFHEVLSLKNNVAVYEPHEDDPSCAITFNFKKNIIEVKEKTDDYNSGCGFGHAVVADGIYKRLQTILRKDSKH
jgi:hypothetical protein